jgi:antitoxin component YwqK of YwqJK toxin-antitoxin module
MRTRSMGWILALGLSLSASSLLNPSIISAEDDYLVPAPGDDTAAAEEATVEDGVEIIRERFPNRAVKIERAVIRDEKDNYVNHGSWREWDAKGTLVAQGEYRHSKRHGDWTAWHYRKSGLFQQSPFRDYVAPFVSQATFKDGELHGTWTMTDGKKRKVMEYNYEDGLRHGTCTKWYANGSKMEEVEFAEGELHGQYRRFAPDGKVVADNDYEQGRTTGRKVTYYKNRKTKSEGMYLLARQELSGKDDWWNLHLATFVKHGQDERHGQWQSWYPNGQLQVRAAYDHDVPANQSTWAWWYQNGQQAVEGHYRDGQQHGRWVWWHTNGQKKLEGEYVMSEPSDRWIWWKTDGLVMQKMDFSEIDAKSVPSRKTTSVATERSVLSVPLNAAIPQQDKVKN